MLFISMLVTCAVESFIRSIAVHTFITNRMMSQTDECNIGWMTCNFYILFNSISVDDLQFFTSFATVF